MAVSVGQLLDMSADELDALFRASPPGPVPTGEAAGTAIVKPGTPLADVASRVVQAVAWQGKVFDPDGGALRNRVSPVGAEEIAARVYEGTSWFDGNPCIVLDYSETSFVAQSIRDEIREVAPDVYLGIVYVGDTKTIFFTLEFGLPERKPGLWARLVGRVRALFGRPAGARG
ncbi:MAG: hypothetical protein U5Q44_01890 [Dehalococcoidia bacterium]|nr:hypothetical protein [Dehalococcoidia bacterium]